MLVGHQFTNRITKLATQALDALFPLDDGCILINEVSKLIRVKLIITIIFTLTYLRVTFGHEAHGRCR